MSTGPFLSSLLKDFKEPLMKNSINLASTGCVLSTPQPLWKSSESKAASDPWKSLTA